MTMHVLDSTAVRDDTPNLRNGSRASSTVLRIVGSGLLFATGAIHLDLYVTGYRTIPSIGNLFLFQVISAFVLAAALLIWGSRVTAVAGAGLAISTLTGYLVALRVNLFGFREVRTTAGIVAGIVEIVGFATLAAFALRPRNSSSSSELRPTTSSTYVRAARAGALAVVVIATVALVVSLTVAGSTPSSTTSGHTVLDSRSVGGVPVLTNAKGFTLYWFVPDTPTSSACYGTCAVYWPPVPGTPTAGAGVSGTIGTIRRADGSTQATYDSHPLYTYLGDSAPGQANGNNITLNGGVWHEMAAAG